MVKQLTAHLITDNLAQVEEKSRGKKKPKKHFNTFKEIWSQLTQYKRHRKDWGIPIRDFQDSTFTPQLALMIPYCNLHTSDFLALSPLRGT